MVKLVYLNGFWLLIAIGAFVVGRTVQVGEVDERATAGYRSGDGSDPLAGGLTKSSGGSGARAAARDDDGKEIGQFGGVALSPDAMRMAVNSILADGDPMSRQRRFAELLESLTPENARAAVEAIRDAPRSGWAMYQELNLLTYAWGRLDGPAALEYAMGLEGRGREWTMGSVLSGWANEDPEGAKTWVAAVEDEGERAGLMRGLVNGLAQKDIKAATDFVYSLDPETPRLDDLIETVARRQMALGLLEAASWSATLPDGEVKGSALHTVAREFVRSDPAEAAKWVGAFAEDEFAGRAIAEISEEWAERDVVAALDWATGLPAGENRSRALSETVSEWADEDPTAAGEYVAALEPGRERDTIIAAYARRVVDDEPESAMEWAASIAEDDLRNQAITSTAREWMSRDVVGASAWLESAELPETVTEAILQPIERRGDRWRR